MASTTEYDEDVILPTSPLSQYINEYEAFRDNDFNECEELPVMKNYNFLKSFHMKSKLCYCKTLILGSIMYYLSFLYNIFVPCFIPFEYSDLKHILETAKNNKVLISEDLTILSNYESDDDFSGETKVSNSSLIQQCFQLFAFALIFMILRSITITNIITNEDIFSLFSGESYFMYILLQIFILIISIVLYINIFIITGFIIVNLLELFLCKALCYSVQKKLYTTGCIMVTIRKCIRLIQEAELIARGFTSASVPGIVERLELSAGLPISSPQRQYPELRKCVFMWIRKMFMIYKSSTQILIKNKKIGPVLDFSSQSFAMLDLKEFGNLLKYDINFDVELPELLKLTDGLSVSSLKTMYLLLELQVSEFYKYLYLITSFLISDDSLFSCWKKITHFYNLKSCVKDLQNEDIFIWKKACETHKYYKNIDTQSNTEDNIPTVKKSDSSHLEINVHNMSLHLKAALKRLVDFEELLELEKKSGETRSENYVKKVAEIMKEIKSEVDAYHDYYKKCNKELESLLYGETKSPLMSTLQGKIKEDVETVKAITNPRCDSDPVIEDEIFEAIVTKSFQDMENYSEDFTVDKQKDFAVSGKLLRELKNVLVLKADEHRVREEKAMAKKFNQGITEKTSIINSPEELKLNSKSNIQASESDSDVQEHSETLFPDCSSLKNSVSCEDEEESTSTNSDTDVKFPNKSLETKNSFAASIAALALQRQKNLGIVQDICFSDSNESDDEIISN